MDSAENNTLRQECKKRCLHGIAESDIQCKRPKMVFQTRCNPKVIFKMIHRLRGYGKFRYLLYELGLEFLLEFRLTRLQRGLCADLARRVDVDKGTLMVHGSDIPLTYASVTKIMGLQCYGEFDNLNEQLLKEEQIAICSKYNLDGAGKISTYTLSSYLQSSHKFDEVFKAHFLLFVLATLIRPTKNVHLHYKEYLPLLKQMNCLAQFNWAKFMLDGLLDDVLAFQLRGAKSLGGCVLYLQLLYLNCISPVSWTRYDECLMATPSLRHWTDERVSVIIKLMREKGGLESNMVQVRTNGVPPSDATIDNYVLPQLLMHEVRISRLQRRLDDKDFRPPQILEYLSQAVSEVTSRVQSLEHRFH